VFKNCAGSLSGTGTGTAVNHYGSTTLTVISDFLFLEEELYFFPLFQSLEDNPEFEYLRNILYEYMLGRQPMILVKVGLMPQVGSHPLSPLFCTG
jgi:hypothetical protein